MLFKEIIAVSSESYETRTHYMQRHWLLERMVRSALKG
jgi:hypothetical protein